MLCAQTIEALRQHFEQGFATLLSQGHHQAALLPPLPSEEFLVVPVILGSDVIDRHEDWAHYELDIVQTTCLQPVSLCYPFDSLQRSVRRCFADSHVLFMDLGMIGGDFGFDEHGLFSEDYEDE